MEELVQPAVPEAAFSAVMVGGIGSKPEASSRGEHSLTLKPLAERTPSNLEVANDGRAPQVIQHRN